MAIFKDHRVSSVGSHNDTIAEMEPRRLKACVEFTDLTEKASIQNNDQVDFKWKKTEYVKKTRIHEEK